MIGIGGAIGVVIVLALVGLRAFRAVEGITGKTMTNEAFTIPPDGAQWGTVKVTKSSWTWTLTAAPKDGEVVIAFGPARDPNTLSIEEIVALLKAGGKEVKPGSSETISGTAGKGAYAWVVANAGTAPVSAQVKFHAK